MSADPLIGTVIAGHRIEAVIGKGAMGVVYRVTHVQLDRTRALKLLPAHLAEDRSFRGRFEREWRLAAMIEHPNIVEVLDAGEERGQLYIVMRYVPGTDLGVIVGEAPLEPARALRILEQIASALDAAHERGLVHRDVKPSNILVGAGDHSYLSDFGIAKSTGTRGLTQVGAFLGTIDFAAPEQFEGGDLDARTDVYALGGVLFSCLTGGPPYPHDTDAQVMRAHLLEPPPRATDVRPELPSGVDHVIATAMEKQKERRYQGASELVAALRAALEPSPTVAAPVVAEEPPSRRAETVAVAPGTIPVASAPATRPPEAAPPPPPPPAPAEAPPAPPPPAAPPTPSEPVERRSRRNLVGAGVVLAVVVAAIVAAVVVLSGGGETSATGTDTETGGDTETSPTTTVSSGSGVTSPAVRWTRITPKSGVNTDIVALARTRDGVLHVAWERREANNRAGIWHTAIGAEGRVVGKPNPIVTGWLGVNKPDLIATPDGGLRVFFGGLRGQGPSDPNNSLNTATSTPSGRIWSLVEGSVTRTTTVYARTVGAALTRDGTPVVAWDGNRTEAAYHFGTDPSGREFRYVEPLSKETCGCPLLPDIGVDSVSGEVVIGWHSLLRELPGIHVQTIRPSGPGPARQAPGSMETDSQRVGITGRIGAPGVYLGYASGSPVTGVRLWRAGTKAPVFSINAPSVRFVSIAAAPQGRLWLMWARDQQLFFTRTNKAATKFGPIVSVVPPRGTTAIWKLAGQGSLGHLDAFASVSTPGSLATWQARVLPSLTLEASAKEADGGGRTITFRALDAGEPVAGATVKVGAQTLTTGANGAVVLTRADSANVSAVVSKAGYLPAKTDV